MKLIQFFTILLGLGCVTASAAVPAEPSTSALAHGNWIKIRVTQDAVYELTYDELKALGFENPEAVTVYGYEPTVLLTHDANLIPADVSPVHTVHTNGKMLFYGKGDTDYAPELWTFTESASSHLHKKHSHSYGATYFLSDEDAGTYAVKTQKAPANTSAANLLTTHTSLVYHEDDAINYGNGGFTLAGPGIGKNNPEETHSFTIAKVAGESATMVYKSILTNTSQSANNYLATAYSPEITAEASTGSSPARPGSYQVFTQSIRFQPLTLPVKDEEATYTVTFSINPNGSKMSGDCALDFFGLRYNRKNNLEGENQRLMYFENFTSAATVELAGVDNSWLVWNVTAPMAPINCESNAEDGKFYLSLEAAPEAKPNQVVAFNPLAAQPKPEIIGRIQNQNLHALATPDMVILTSKHMLGVAESIADFHYSLQGIEVAVVDQQMVFNEYSSGNVSPEAVRRFLMHLDGKQAGKLKGLLLLGPATTTPSKSINDDELNVISAQAEDYVVCPFQTKNYCSDTFFGRLSAGKETSSTWGSRVSQLQILANPIDIAVGRLPFSSQSEVNDYYKKARVYLETPPAFPSIGNVVLASDYSLANQEHHLSNAEKVGEAISAIMGNNVTLTRVASNLVSQKNNDITKKIMADAFANGVGLFEYFGHGNSSAIAGTNNTTDFLMDMLQAEKYVSPGRYPLMYMGSCSTAPFDQMSKYLASELISNPNGGAIGVIASGRQVFQPQNEALGIFVAEEYYKAEAGEWLGNIWSRAQHAAIMKKATLKDYVVNHLDYNYIGDPALPYYGVTHSVEMDALENNALQVSSKNRLTGVVKNANGSIDSNFSGNITVNVYDTPEVAANLLGESVTTGYVYYPEISLDQTVIAKAHGTVSNGRFDFEFVMPILPSGGSHRVQVYAWSDDGVSRGLGSMSEVVIAPVADGETPEFAPVAINLFELSEEAVLQPSQVALKAVISAPAGIATSAGVTKPIRLTVDGAVATDISGMLTPDGRGNYILDYVTQPLGGGKHNATLSVMDTQGNWADSSLSFVVDNAPKAQISAVVAHGGQVIVELASELAAGGENRLIIEKINGDVVIDAKMKGSTHAVTLQPGLYSAYVQCRTSQAAAGTPRLRIAVD